MPQSVTPQQLEVLLNGLLSNEEKMPYSFYVEGQVRGVSHKQFERVSDEARHVCVGAGLLCWEQWKSRGVRCW